VVIIVPYACLWTGYCLNSLIGVKKAGAV
jgi:hypothetical protein